jgi:hypothetical protein
MRPGHGDFTFLTMLSNCAAARAISALILGDEVHSPAKGKDLHER